MTGECLQLTVDEVAGHDAAGTLLAALFGDDEFLEIIVGEDFHRAQVNLALQCSSTSQLQLLTCLTTGVVGTGDLHTTEGTGCQGTAVFAGEWSADGVHVVDDAHRLVGQAPAVGLTAAVVATLDGVLDVAVRGVVVDLLAAGGVHATLRGDGVCTTWGVVVGEDLHLVAELTKSCSSATAGEAGTNNQNLKLTTVQRGDQVHVVFLVLPHVLGWDTLRLLGIQDGTEGDTFNGGCRGHKLWPGSGISMCSQCLTFQP